MNDRDRRALVIGVVLVAAAGAYRFGLSPALDHWREARSVAAQRQAVVDDLHAKLGRRDALMARLEPRFGPGVHEPLDAAENVQITFPRAVQQAISRGGGKPTQIEVQGLKRIRGVTGVELLSLRVRIDCPSRSIPEILQQLRAAELPVIVESLDMVMANNNRRDEWRLSMTLSTPSLTTKNQPL